jgi:histidyl-tRNA synthetase
VARRYGFSEYEAPVVETTDLYRKKSGDEITNQLFCFKDKKGRDISLRPEVTPSLARMATARQRHYGKPMKWFQIGSCFRYEEPQKGRTREFNQFNADILGDASLASDAELIALAIDVMREFGMKKDDFVIRLSDRRLWSHFLEEQKVDAEKSPVFLQIIDKMEKVPESVTAEKLDGIGISLAQVLTFINSASESHAVFAPLRENLTARGLWEFVKIDPGIVRGLAYYTGTVFEVFDLKHGLRAVAGGGRYDNLCGLLGGNEMPCTGFAMGDVVLGEMLAQTPGAQFGITDYLLKATALDAYVVVADETARSHALAAVQELRRAGIRTDYAFGAQKVGKQFQAAEERKARYAVIFGSEFPTVKIKNLTARSESSVSSAQLVEELHRVLQAPDLGPLIAAV